MKKNELKKIIKEILSEFNVQDENVWVWSGDNEFPPIRDIIAKSRQTGMTPFYAETNPSQSTNLILARNPREAQSIAQSKGLNGPIKPW